LKAPDLNLVRGVGALVRFVIWLMVCFGSMATAAAPQGDLVPFVEPGGLLQAGLTRSMVVAQLGPPPVTRERYEAGDPIVTGALVFEYPELGLAFVVPPVERSEADPRIAFLVVKPPAVSHTPDGLRLGMTLKDVRALAPGGRIEHRGSRIEWSGSPGAKSRKVSFVVSTENVILYMAFDAGIPHEPAYKKWIEKARWLFAVVLVFVWLFFLPSTIKGYPAYIKRRIEALAPLRARLGKGMLVLAPVLFVVGVPLVREGGAVRLLGVLFMLGGAGILLPALYNLALGDRLTPARLLALVLLGVATMILLVLFR